MQHIDEHTLELYVLRAPEAESRRKEIDAHLPACRGCRTLVEEMRQFHAGLADELEKKDPAPSFASALARRRQGIAPHAGEYSAPLRYKPRTPMQKMRYFVMRYPVAAAAAGISFAGAFIVIGFILSNGLRSPQSSQIADRNPVYYAYNPSQQMLEAYNAEHQLLWQKKCPFIAAERELELKHGTKRTVVADLDGSGVNEIVTTLAVLGLDSSDAGVGTVKAFDGNGELRWQRRFSEAVPYAGREYGPLFAAGPLVALNGDGRGGASIFVAATHYLRSPALVYRLDGSGTIIGRYWHFGTIVSFMQGGADGAGTKLIIGAKNDVVDDSTHGEYASLIVLDPFRIVGDRRSSLAPVYGLPVSEAEDYYIRFSRTDIDSAEFGCTAISMLDRSDPARLRATLGRDGAWNFDFTFDASFRLLGVQSQDRTDALHKEYRRQGKVRGEIDGAYLANLKALVRYWDGAGWSPTVSMVRPRAVIP